MSFTPGNRKKCSGSHIPIPEALSGLAVPTPEERLPVDPWEYFEYRCKNPNMVVNDGWTFKVRCHADTMKFQLRPWQTCRERRVCLMPAPRPPDSSRLAFSTSSVVLELDHAVYECLDSGWVVPGTIDGKFRTPCKKIGAFEQSVRITWPTCVPKPNPSCDSLPDIDLTKYRMVQPTTPQMYLPVGSKLIVACADSDELIGDAPTVSYICTASADGTSASLQGFSGSLPICRARDVCSRNSIVEPSLESGLRAPYQTQDVEERLYIDYPCREGHPWKLLGNYETPDEFDGDNVQIVDGRLRVFCTQGGSFGEVRKWPTCRDSSITECSTFPDLTSHELVGVSNSPVPIGGDYTIKCFNPYMVTDTFLEKTLTCGYDGNIILPETNFTDCRLARTCPAPPSHDAANTFLTALTTPSPFTEFMVQSYECQAGYTLGGVESEIIVNGRVELPCKLDAAGAWVVPAPSIWPPVCLPIATSCPGTAIPTIPGLVALSSTSGTIPVGDTAKYRCLDASEVTDQGQIIELTCTQSGLFTPPPTGLTCRATAPCVPPPVPDRTVTRILSSLTQGVREWGKAAYECQVGTSFPAGTTLNDDGMFEVQCQTGGIYPVNIVWPVCEITHCLSIQSGFADLDLQPHEYPLPVGDYADYTCKISGQITNDQDGPLRVLCNASGVMEYPDPMPVCRSRKTCSSQYPIAGPAFNLKTSESTGVKEFEKAYYSCVDGAVFDSASLANPAINVNIEADRFGVQCQLNGTWDNTTFTWPTCQFTHCAQNPDPADHPDLLDMVANNGPNIAVGDDVVYECSSTNFVMSQGKYLNIECMPDGTWNVPTPVPDCRSALSCSDADLPAIPGDKGYLPTESTGVIEFEHAVYKCGQGRALNVPSGTPQVVNGELRIECQPDNPTNPTTATFEAVTTWHMCEVSHCVTYPTVDSTLTPVYSSMPPVPLGDNVAFRCVSPGKVMDTGLTYELECLNTGNFSSTPAEPTCRDPATCPPPPDANSASTNLENPNDLEIKEFEKAIYRCKPGSSLAGQTGTGIVGDEYHLSCNLGATYDTFSPPTCAIQFCPTIPTLAGFTATTVGAVPVGSNAEYVCETSGHVTDSGSVLELECGADGTFTAPNPVPTCRAAAICPAPPTPPATALHLSPSQATNVPEFGEAEYACASGYTLWGTSVTGVSI